MSRLVILTLTIASLSACGPAAAEPDFYGEWACIDNDTENIFVDVAFNKDQTAQIDWRWTGLTPKGAGEIRYHSELTFKLFSSDGDNPALSMTVLKTELDQLTYNGIVADSETRDRVESRIKNDIIGNATSYFLNPKEDRQTDLSLLLNIGNSPSSLSCKRKKIANDVTIE